MASDLEKARIMFKLARKNNWNACYDRTEYFKRFPNLNEAIKELSKLKWVIVHNKARFTAISLNTLYKKEIIELIEKEMPHVKGAVK